MYILVFNFRKVFTKLKGSNQYFKTLINFFINSALVNVIFLLNAILSTKVIGIEGKAEQAIYSTNLEFILLIVAAGTPSSFLYFYSRTATKNYAKRNILIHFIFILLILLFSLGFGAVLSLSASYIFYNLIILNTLFLFSNNILTSIARIEGKHRLVNFNQAILPSIILVFSLYLTYNDITISFFNYQILVMLAQVLQTILIIKTINVSNFKIKLSFKAVLLKITPFYRYSFLALISTVIQLLNFKLDHWLVARSCPNEELACYYMASNLFQMFWSIPNSASIILFSFFSNIVSDNYMKLKKTLLFMAMGLTILGLILFFSIDFLVENAFDAEFESVSGYFKILLVSLIPVSLSSYLGNYFAKHNLLKITILGSTIGLVTNILLNWILIPKYGATGAAITSVITYTLSFFYLIGNLLIYKK